MAAYVAVAINKKKGRKRRMKLVDFIGKFEHKSYYVVELSKSGSIDKCPEYYTKVNEIDAKLLMCDVMNYDLVSDDFAVVYLDIDTVSDTSDFINAVTDLVDSMGDIESINIRKLPDEEKYEVTFGKSVMYVEKVE